MSRRASSGAGMRRKANRVYLPFVALFMALSLLPLVGLVWTGEETALDGGSLSPAPEVTTESGSLNMSYLQDLGDYFEDRFAYRSTAIDINARVRAGIFMTSPTDQVIVGTDGWLYYGGTLSDYLAQDQMSYREARNIAHNLALVQGYANAMGSEFVFTIAPNKNSLYPSHMPYYYLDGANGSRDLLRACLEAERVNYVDLFDLFGRTEGDLYYRTDSHWTTEGALLAADALLEACGRGPVSASQPEEGETVGDIERMLYPVSAQTEPSLVFSTGSWEFVDGSKSVEDTLAYTASDGGEGSLLMYRDSFANSLMPYLAPEFTTAQFSKLIPYNLTEVSELRPDVVIIERAERHIDLLNESPPILYAPTTQLAVSETVDSESRATWHQDGGLRVVEGYVDESLIDDEDEIFIMIEGAGEEKTYVPFYVGPNGMSDDDEGTVEGGGGTGDADNTGSEGASDDAESDGDGDEETPRSEYGFRMYLDESSLTEDEYTISIVVSGSHRDRARAVKTIVLKR